MNLDQINNFLSAKTNYMYGVSLLSAYHPNKRLMAHLARLESQSNWEKLIYELEKILKQNNYVEENENVENTENNQSISAEFSARSQSSTESEVYNAPLENRAKKELHVVPFAVSNNNHPGGSSRLLDKVLKKRVLLYRERGHFHGRLHESLNDNNRREIATKIINLQDDIDAINNDLRAIESGNVPRELVLKMMNANDYKSYRNYQTYVSKYSAHLKRDDLTDKQRTDYEAKLQEYSRKINNFFLNV